MQDRGLGVLTSVNQGVQGLKPYQPGKPVDELERELGIEGAIKLASNENPLGPSAAVLEVIQCHLKNLALYPDGSGFRLRARLAAFHKVTPEMVTLGNGSNDILELVARTWLRPDREAMFFQYSFAVYPIVTQATGARAVEIKTLDWQQPLENMLAAIGQDTAVIFIANPNNPTGTMLTADALTQFIRQVPDHVLIVVDEAYFEYVNDQAYSSMIECVHKHPNLMVTRTFSKAYGLAGLRMGFAISHPDVADRLNRVRQPFNVNLLALVAAEAGLDDQAYIQRTVETNTAGMQKIESALSKLGLDFIPSSGNFISFSVGADRSAMDVYQKLLLQGVIVRPMGAYRMDSYLRVTIGSDTENDRFIKALGGAIS